MASFDIFFSGFPVFKVKNIENQNGDHDPKWKTYHEGLKFLVENDDVGEFN